MDQTIEFLPMTIVPSVFVSVHGVEFLPLTLHA